MVFTQTEKDFIITAIFDAFDTNPALFDTLEDILTEERIKKWEKMSKKRNK